VADALEEDWEDLSDEELAARLVQRGVSPGLVDLMVADRECCVGCRQLITEALD
jgi:hypothetical protein